MISDDLINILVCPKCQGKVSKADDGIICGSCQLSYPVNEDIPVMLIDAAQKINQPEA